MKLKEIRTQLNIEPNKIQLSVSGEKVCISDRMPINFLNISIVLISTSAFAIYFLGAVGLVYSLVFALGYALFRYFAWVIWKKIEIDQKRKKLTVTHMVFNNRKRTEMLTNKFEYSDLILKEFEQSGMKRAMIQYQGREIKDLLLLTHAQDIDTIKNWLVKERLPST